MKLIRPIITATAILVAMGIPSGASAAAPVAKLMPLAVTFGSTNPQGPYPPQMVTLTNSGDSPLLINNITVENQSAGSSDFAQSNNCYPFPRTLAPLESCVITIVFVPGAYGVRHGSLLLVDNAADSPQRVALTGHAYPFRAMYTLDGYGGLHPANEVSPVMSGGGYWRGWNIARAAALLSDGSGGYTLDGFGGVHAFGSAPPASGATYFGWDIARDVVLTPGSASSHASGYVLEGWGGLHPFGGAPAVTGAAYWHGWDIAKRVKLLPDGSGGYVLDGWGALHPFAIGTNVLPRSFADTAYWPHWNIARDFDLMSNSTPSTAAGFTLDGFGGVHAFGFSPAAPVSVGGLWPGWDIARSIRLNPTSTTATPFGWTMEGWGGVRPFNAGQDVPQGAYWSGWDIASELVVVR